MSQHVTIVSSIMQDLCDAVFIQVFIFDRMVDEKYHLTSDSVMEIEIETPWSSVGWYRDNSL